MQTNPSRPFVVPYKDPRCQGTHYFKGEPNRTDASWPANVENAQVFFVCWHHLVVLLHSLFVFCFVFALNLSSSGRSPSAIKSRKGLICDVFGTFATQTCFGYDVIDTDCRAQSSINGDRVSFHDFQTSEATHKGVN